MKYKTVLTANIIRLVNALRSVQSRGVQEEGMGLLSGHTGEGKTTAIAYVANREDGIYLRACATWTVRALLHELMRELGLQPHHAHDPMLRAASQKLSLQPLPVFVDEADYLFEQPKMLDVLRDLYDIAQIPVFLVGSDDLSRRLQSHGRFERLRRRITQWVRFAGLSFEDAAKIAAELCEVELDEPLVQLLFSTSKGNVAALTAGIRLCERFAQANDLPALTAATWGKRPLPSPGPSGFIGSFSVPGRV